MTTKEFDLIRVARFGVAQADVEFGRIDEKR